MELLLLGTGSPRGWPEPGCPCASCARAAALRQVRAPTSALLDDVLLLDPQPDAAAAGHPLTGVRRVLRCGAGEAVPGAELLGPASVCPGDTVQAGAHRLRALAQGDRLAWDVTGPDGRRLLYAPDAAPVAAAGPYDLVLLGLTGLAANLAALRAGGAVTESTDVLAVGLGHDAPPPDELDRRLGSWGARVVVDGTRLRAGERPADPTGPRRTLVLGGARSGKSALAEQLLAAQPHVTYVATGGSRADDAEWRDRVAGHVARRPASWRTVETADVAGCLRGADRPLLVDCLGSWLAGRLDAHGVWEGAPEQPVHGEIDELVAAWRATGARVVAVSNEVGSGIVPATRSGRVFRDLLGRLNAAVAAESETVLLTVAGIGVPLRDLPRP